MGNQKFVNRILLIAIGAVCALLFCIHYFLQGDVQKTKEASGYTVDEKNLLSPVDLSNTAEENQTATEAPKTTPVVNPETTVYSYLQGPVSWSKKRVWSGEWGDMAYDGARFGAFGCGLCCMANAYSSLTPYQCTPVDAYHYAKQMTGYRGGGAIDWKYMKQSLNSMGISGALQKKPETYEAFQAKIAAGKAAIVLISSNDSKCYWTENPGHYVTIFLYNKETDKVFLSDSGVPEHNRQWVPLKKIYKSLKTASTWQFFNITGYKEEKDTWKHKTAGGNWVKE